METHLAYCAAVDREVRVYLRPLVGDERRKGAIYVPGVVCQDHAEDCTGMVCPLFQSPGALPDSLLRRLRS
jgi:hypothetical protein